MALDLVHLTCPGLRSCLYYESCFYKLRLWLEFQVPFPMLLVSWICFAVKVEELTLQRLSRELPG